MESNRSRPDLIEPDNVKVAQLSLRRMSLTSESNSIAGEVWKEV